MGCQSVHSCVYRSMGLCLHLSFAQYHRNSDGFLICYKKFWSSFSVIEVLISMVLFFIRVPRSRRRGTDPSTAAAGRGAWPARRRRQWSSSRPCTDSPWLTDWERWGKGRERKKKRRERGTDRWGWWMKLFFSISTYKTQMKIWTEWQWWDKSKLLWYWRNFKKIYNIQKIHLNFYSIERIDSLLLPYTGYDYDRAQLARTTSCQPLSQIKAV